MEAYQNSTYLILFPSPTPTRLSYFIADSEYWAICSVTWLCDTRSNGAYRVCVKWRCSMELLSISRERILEKKLLTLYWICRDLMLHNGTQKTPLWPELSFKYWVSSVPLSIKSCLPSRFICPWNYLLLLFLVFWEWTPESLWIHCNYYL